MPDISKIIEKVKKKVKKGDVICYRSYLGKIKKVTDDGVIIRGPYNEEGLDWEDVITYNKALVSA